MGSPQITAAECLAMRILAADGWEPGTLKMCFELSGTDSVRYHTKGKCSHGPRELSNAIEPVSNCFVAGDG